MEKPVMLLGATGLGPVALDIFTQNNVVVYGFLDDNKDLHHTEIHNITVLGRTDDDGFLKLVGKKCEAFVAVDETDLRRGLVELINQRRKVMPINAIHPLASIASTAYLGHGNMIQIGAVLATGTEIKNHCIIGANAVIDYQAELADYVQVGAGSIINSQAKVEEDAFIGSGVTIVSGVTIGAGARIGAGSVVIADVKKGETVFGNPAKVVNS
ncbi:MAG: NeuD/PglB/VioB family sugar acetyltransferase [Cyclobacteriaceae bacterium]